MLAIKKFLDNVINESLYHLIGQMPIRETIRKHYLKFRGHRVLIPTEKPGNSFFMYEPKIRSSLRPEAPRTTFLNQSTIRFRNAVRNDYTSLIEQKRSIKILKIIRSSFNLGFIDFKSFIMQNFSKSLQKNL